MILKTLIHIGVGIIFRKKIFNIFDTFRKGFILVILQIIVVIEAHVEVVVHYMLFSCGFYIFFFVYIIKMPSKSAIAVYRKRVKTSSCRGLRGRTCNKRSGCKYSSGTKRSFCRKSKNTKRRRSLRLMGR
jgi:hypothetical protein